MSNKVNWLNHEFHVCEHSTNWNDVPGIYIFSGLNQQKQWASYYIGQAESFRNRLPSHEQWGAARKLGATHVHAKSVSKQSDRDNLEKQLIKVYQPPLNTQHK